MNLKITTRDDHPVWLRVTGQWSDDYNVGSQIWATEAQSLSEHLSMKHGCIIQENIVRVLQGYADTASFVLTELFYLERYPSHQPE